MNQQIDHQVLEKIVSDVVSINPRGKKPISGYMGRKIREEGRYVEAGLVFTENDILYGQLYCGVAVLSHDMHFYIQKKKRRDAENFQKLIKEVHNEELQVQGQKAFPEYKGIDAQQMLLDLSVSEIGKPIDIHQLSDERIMHEWYFKPGKRLLEKLIYIKEIRSAVCNTAFPNDFVKSLAEGVKTGAVVKVSTAILAASFSASVFWYPLAAYTAVYVLHFAYDRYCKEFYSL